VTDIPRYAIIATRNRSTVALEGLATVLPQVDTTLVIDNGDDDPIPEPSDEHTLTPYYVLRYEMQPVNLSMLWNAGLDWVEADARRMGADAWDVAVINDDVLLEDGWFETVSRTMRNTDSSAGCTGGVTIVHRRAQPVPLHTRMQGWAFMLRGERGLRLDEAMAWWYADDDLGWRAAADGGMAMVRGPEARNRFPDGQMTPERQTQAQVDGLTFVAKWGTRPW
jgi:hypothetical protein